jgi:beta-barrel assembly-enhancing protease
MRFRTRPRGMRGTARAPKLVVAVIMAVVGLISYYASRQKNPITGETQAIALTADQEVALGLQSAPRVAQQFGGLSSEPELQAYVRGVGERIVARSAAKETAYKFSFSVLADEKTVNAFALPGGPIFITKALLGRLGNEAQLAGVLGHEVGHVVGRHSAEKIAKSKLGQALVGALGVATSDERGRGSAMAQMAGQMAVQMAQLKYGRGDELQSDSLGVRFMSDAGYDPRALIDVMEILASASGGKRQPEFMSSHPDPGNRSGEIRAEIAKRYPGGVPTDLTLGRTFTPRGGRAPAAAGASTR